MAVAIDRWAGWTAGRKRLVEQAAARLPKLSDGVVLDVAAGDGSFSALVAEQTGGRLITHDWSAAETATCAAAGHEAVRGDVRRLPFADHTADVTIAFEIVEHFERWETKQIIDELDRVTKPGGALILSTPNRFSLESAKGIARFLWDGTVWNARDETHQHIFNRQELLALLKPSFKVEQCYGYYPIPELGRRGLPGTYAITTNPLIANICFLLLVIATPASKRTPETSGAVTSPSVAAKSDPAEISNSRV